MRPSFAGLDAASSGEHEKLVGELGNHAERPWVISGIVVTALQVENSSPQTPMVLLHIEPRLRSGPAIGSYCQHNT
ncbi:hypothetical protein HL667_01330 [Bradyrhizobium sp. 83012]|uniref:Uncharacterized protein n=1 Tax=Bradyrhizobium aeschynomenes TaxID=2734909 RepID=A0ABX2C5S1_9BRAD|nr:hypothetical protein [Bradyrhizobium aeschynomenes]NPU13153.1 hypothetical protein [Bradyrhizobium aeschynomenes]NPU63634.1 hypothetical protein [Bradyrhizobium aeschynomenes]